MKPLNLFLSIFFLLPLLTNAFSPNNRPATNQVISNKVIDTIPVKAAPGLLSRIAEVFKFKKYAQLKQRNSIINVIQSTGINDSIIATRENVQLLTDLLNSVKDSSSLNFDLLLQKIDTLKRYALKNNDSIYKQLQVIAQPPTHAEITALAEKIIPIIQNEIIKRHTTSVTAAANTFNLINAAYPLNNFDTAQMQITRKGYIYCFYSPANRNYLDYNFHLLNNIIFNGLDLANANALPVVTDHLTGNRVLSIARNSNCQVLLSISSSNMAATFSFLNSVSRQQKLIDDLDRFISHKLIDGVNVMLPHVNFNYSAQLVSFVQRLTEKINHVTVTLPAFDLQNGYDINKLNQLPVKNFILNFTGQHNDITAAPVITLSGSKYSLQAAASRFLNSSVPFKKLVVSIPYYGVEYDYEKKNSPPRYNTLDNMQYGFTDSLYYDSLAASVYAAVSNPDGEITHALWFDDAVSLNSKYNFIVSNRFGGIAIEPLPQSASIGYTDLWNGIAAVFFSLSPKPVKVVVPSPADSCFCGNDITRDSIIRKALIRLGTANCYNVLLAGSATLKKTISLFMDPCQCGFEDTAIKTPPYVDSLTGATLIRKDLSYYHTYFNKEEEKDKLYHIVFRSAAKRVALHATLLMLTLFIAALAFYFNRYRKIGKTWKLRNKMEIASIALLNLLILTGSLFFYLSNRAPNGTCVQMPLVFFGIIVLITTAVSSALLYYAIFKKLNNEQEP
jgi:spore germination protein YaaH